MPFGAEGRLLFLPTPHIPKPTPCCKFGGKSLENDGGGREGKRGMGDERDEEEERGGGWGDGGRGKKRDKSNPPIWVSR